MTGISTDKKLVACGIRTRDLFIRSEKRFLCAKATNIFFRYDRDLHWNSTGVYI